MLKRFQQIEPVHKVALFALVSAAIIALIGYLNHYSKLDLGEFFNHLLSDFYTNVSSGLAIVAFTVLIIDTLNRRRSEEQQRVLDELNRRTAEEREREDLILQMGSSDNGSALNAVRLLRNRGWLTDGTLRGRNFNRANLQGAELSEADLRNAQFVGADLREANLTQAKLERANLGSAHLEKVTQSSPRAATLWHANLKDAIFGSAVLFDVNFGGANLQGADFHSAKLLGNGITDDTLFDTTTRFPDGTYWEPNKEKLYFKPPTIIGFA